MAASILSKRTRSHLKAAKKLKSLSSADRKQTASNFWKLRKKMPMAGPWMTREQHRLHGGGK